LAVDSSSNVFVADRGAGKIRKITPGGFVTTFALGLNNPQGLGIDSANNIYVAEQSGAIVSKYSPLAVQSTYAGMLFSAGSTDGTSTIAQFNSPYSVAVDKGGNVFVTEFGASRVRKITTAGQVTTVAGALGPGYADGGPLVAQFNQVWGVAVNMSGTVFVVDVANRVIRQVVP
jgi:glucose/arabinose dehydrogenase